MTAKISIARANLDVANGLLETGATTVITNDQQTAYLTTVDAGGSNVVQASTEVFAEDLGVAREADPMSNGVLIMSGSDDVFAG